MLRFSSVVALVVFGLTLPLAAQTTQATQPPTAAPDSITANLIARTTVRRWSGCERIRSYGLPSATLVHPDVDTFGVELGEDILVYQNAVLGAGATLDDATVVFMGGVVGHGSRMGRCCVVGPGAVINARRTKEKTITIRVNEVVLTSTVVSSASAPMNSAT